MNLLNNFYKKHEDEEKLREKFIENTPKGSEFAFSGCRSGLHFEDGTVFYNSEGIVLRYFDSIEDFSDYYFLDKKIPHKESAYVGDRDDDGFITWHEEHYRIEDLDENEDGNCVFLKPVNVEY